MAAKTCNNLITDYQRASGLYETMRAHFERFCSSAKRLQEPGSDVDGIKVSTEDGALSLTFLDRHIRVSMRLDRKNRKGVLHVEDRSVEGPHQHAQTIARIPYTVTGETELGGGFDGDKISLGIDPDHITLALHIIDTALDHDPWK